MAVYDRWHLTHPKSGAAPCKCSRGKHKLYPSAEHGQGDRWQVRWTDPDGKIRKANRPKRGGWQGEADPAIYAEAFDAKVHAELHTGTYVDPSAGQITLETYARRWRAGLTGDPGTMVNIDDRLAHIIDIDIPEGARTRRAPGKSPIAHRPMQALARTPSAVQQWIAHLERKGLGPQYIKLIVGTLSSIFLAAIDDGVVHRNPVKARSVSPPPVPPRRIVPWTLEMCEAAGVDLGERDRVMVDLGAGAGLRQGEIFGLAEGDVEFLGGRVVHVRRQVKVVDKVVVFAPPKGGKQRDVPLSSELGLRLAAHIAAHPPVEVTLPWREPGGRPVTVRLLCTRAGCRPYHRGIFSYRWQRARAAAGAEPTRENGMHVLRHTAASSWLAEGVDINTVAEWLGHADPGFTLRTYTHLMPKVDERGRRAMDRFFRPSDDSADARKMPSGGQG